MPEQLPRSTTHIAASAALPSVTSVPRMRVMSARLFPERDSSHSQRADACSGVGNRWRDANDRIAANCNVTAIPRTAAAVHDPPVANNEIV